MAISLAALALTLSLAGCTANPTGTTSTEATAPRPSSQATQLGTSSPVPTAGTSAIPPSTPATAATTPAQRPAGRQPALSLNPPEGATGQQVQVTGAGFVPGSKVRLRSGLPEAGAAGIDLAEAQADQAGEFATTFAVPAANAAQTDGSLLISAIEEKRGEVVALAVLFNQHGTTPQADQNAVQGVVLTGEVGDVEASAHVISFGDQVHGFTTVAVGPTTEITAIDGSPKTLQDIRPGSVIQTAGSAIGSGAVLASKIRILPDSG